MLAYYYNWSYSEIKSLPKTAREVFCYKVKKQIDAENGKKDNNMIANDMYKLGGKPYKESSV